MQIARIGQSMVSITIVLFALTSYHSAAIAGIATFCSIFPGILVSPIAGALLDRLGRTRLVVLDYLIALGTMTLRGLLALTGSLRVNLLVLVLVMCITGFLNGPLDIALFTLRQRRTDPGWIGPAFAA